MNTFRVRIVAALCLVLGCDTILLSAQNLAFREKTVVVFDKLQKTVLDFTAKTKPKFSVVPKSAESLVSVRFDKTLQSLVVEKPLPAGIYTFTLESGKNRAQTTLTVLPCALDTTSPAQQGIVPLFYGKRLALRTKLLPEAALLSKEQFSIDYQVGNEPESRHNAYSEAWVGPNVPAAARIITMSVVWQYPLTGERVIVWSQKTSPTQTPPELSTEARKTEARFDSAANTLTFTVRGIRLDAGVPFDADNSIKDASRSIKASLNDAEVNNEAAIDFASPETRIETEGSGKEAWKSSLETLKLTENKYDAKSGEFLFVLKASGLPQGTKVVRGSVKLGGITGKIVNRKAGAVGTKELSVVVPLEWK